MTRGAIDTPWSSEAWPAMQMERIKGMCVGTSLAMLLAGRTSMTAIAHMLLGAAFVAVGVLAAAVADRIRGIRLARETKPRRERARPTRFPTVHASNGAQTASPARSFREGARPPAVDTASTPREVSRTLETVVTALVTAGYTTPIAREATLGCYVAERVTVEDWTRAALRRAAKGVTS